jgi:uncharacterized protein (UPF0333 family)
MSPLRQTFAHKFNPKMMPILSAIAKSSAFFIVVSSAAKNTVNVRIRIATCIKRTKNKLILLCDIQFTHVQCSEVQL